MKTETQLAKLIRVTKDKARYDSQVKKLLANRAILAWILKTCTEEFAPYSPREIEDCILGEPVISRDPSRTPVRLQLPSGRRASARPVRGSSVS